MKIRLLILLFCFSLDLPDLYGEVYWLTPWKKSKTTKFESIIDSDHLLTEPIKINGVRTNMIVRLISKPLLEVIADLSLRQEGLKFEAGTDGVLFNMPSSSGRKERILLVESEALLNVTAFTMELPEKMPIKFEWPTELPRARGAIKEVIYFERTGVIYGSFAEGGEKSSLMESLASELRGMDFFPLTGDKQGDVFLRQNPLSMISLNVNDNGDGLIIYSPLDKR